MRWIKHDTDANADAKLQNVLLDYGLEGYGLYWYCIELIASNVSLENLTFELEHDARIIARNTGSTAVRVEEMMRYFVKQGLFEQQNGVITCLKIAKRLDKSMTSNPKMRRIIDQLKYSERPALSAINPSDMYQDKAKSSDTVMTNHDGVMTQGQVVENNEDYENCKGVEENTTPLQKCNPLAEMQPPLQSSQVTDIKGIMTPSEFVMQDKIRLDKNSKEDHITNSDNKQLAEKPSKASKSGKFTFTDEDMRLAHWMYQAKLVNNPSAPKPNFPSWASQIRLMRERDNHSHHDIAEMFQWTQRDSFWFQNILSPRKLRQQWEQLSLRRKDSPTIMNPKKPRREVLDNDSTDWADELEAYAGGDDEKNQ